MGRRKMKNANPGFYESNFIPVSKAGTKTPLPAPIGTRAMITAAWPKRKWPDRRAAMERRRSYQGIMLSPSRTRGDLFHLSSVLLAFCLRSEATPNAAAIVDDGSHAGVMSLIFDDMTCHSQ
jgi:hypothetical protein